MDTLILPRWQDVPPNVWTIEAYRPGHSLSVDGGIAGKVCPPVASRRLTTKLVLCSARAVDGSNREERGRRLSATEGLPSFRA